MWLLSDVICGSFCQVTVIWEISAATSNNVNFSQ